MGARPPGLVFAEPDALEAAVVEGLRGLAARRPLVLAVDDLGLIDVPSSRVLESLVAGRMDVPVLVAATCRDNEREPLADAFRGLVRRIGGVDLEVTPLARRDLGQLVVEHLGGRGLTPTLERRLFEQSQGNPLFCLELVRMLCDRGEIVLDQGRWSESGVPQAPAVPRSVGSMVERRLATMPATARELLSVAAELGPVLSYATLADVAGETSGLLLGDIDASLSAGLLTEREGGYAFAHPLYRTAIRQLTGVARRGAVELRIAVALAGVQASAPPAALLRAADTAVEPLETAMHALAAVALGRPDARPLAVAFGFRAGERAMALFDRSNAADVLHRALAAWRTLQADIAGELPASAALVMLARLRAAEGDDVAATGAFREAIAVARTPAELATAYSAFHWVPYQHGEFEAALAILDEGKARLRPDGSTQHAILHRDEGWCLARLGRVDEALAILGESAAILEAAGDRRETMRTLDYLGDVLTLLGRYESATGQLERSLALALELGDPRGEVLARFHLGAALTSAGRPERAEPHLRRALDLAHQTGDRYVESVAAWMSADTADALGDADAAVAYLERELRLLRAIGGNAHNEALAHAHLAHLSRRAGDRARASREASRARSLAARTGDPAYVGLVEAALGVERWADVSYH